MESTTSPLDELAGFLSGNSASSVSPQNPLSQNADPSASPSNPNMNPSNPTAWANPSNPELNPNLPTAVNNPSNPQYNPSMPGATNNPSNYQYNPSMPGSLTNPASPLLNPNYPGSLMNPANPMHNPDYPVHEEYERPPGLSDNASLPPAHASQGNWRVADAYTQDTRQHADPTEPRASEPPAPLGCTCRNGTDSGAKLHCPIHGLNGQWEEAHDWSTPEGHPVGYPDQPRGWVDAVHSKTLEGSAVPEADMRWPWHRVDHPNGVAKHALKLSPPKPPVKLPSKFITDREQHERGKRRWRWKRHPIKRAVLSPDHYKEWLDRDMNSPYLYHATTKDVADDILKEGLYPHDHGRMVSDNNRLRCPNCNFTTNNDPEIAAQELNTGGIPCPQCGDDFLQPDSASQWAGQYLEPRPDHTYMGNFKMVGQQYFTPGKHRLLRIDTRKLDPKLINPDEDAFWPGHYPSGLSTAYDSVMENDPPPSADDYGEHGTTFGQWADMANLGSDSEETRHSLMNHGSIAYNGVVPPEAIEEADPRNGMALRPAQPEPAQQEQPEQLQMAMAKVGEHDAKLTAMNEVMRHVVASLGEKDKRPRKLIIHRDEQGRMASIEEA